MKFRAWWHSHLQGHAQKIRHVTVPLWASDEGTICHCSCGEVMFW